MTEPNALLEELKAHREAFFAKRGSTVVLITPGAEEWYKETPTSHTIEELDAAIAKGWLCERLLVRKHAFEVDKYDLQVWGLPKFAPKLRAGDPGLQPAKVG